MPAFSKAVSPNPFGKLVRRHCDSDGDAARVVGGEATSGLVLLVTDSAPSAGLLGVVVGRAAAHGAEVARIALSGSPTSKRLKTGSVDLSCARAGERIDSRVASVQGGVLARTAHNA